MEAEKIKLNETIKALKDEASHLIDAIKKTMKDLKTTAHNPAIDEGKRQVVLKHLESMVQCLDPEDSGSFQNQVEMLVWYCNFWSWASISHQDPSKNEFSYEERMINEKIKEEIKKLAQTRLCQINPPLISQAQESLSHIAELLKKARQEIILSRAEEPLEKITPV